MNSINSINSVGAGKVGVENISLRAFRRRIVRYVTLLALPPSWLSGNRASKSPPGGVVYTVLHGIISSPTRE